MNESTLFRHYAEFMIHPADNVLNASRIGDHHTRSHDFGKVTSRDDCWGRVVCTNFETSLAPVHEFHGPLWFQSAYCRVNIFRDYISSVHQATCHVSGSTSRWWRAWYKHVCRFKDSAWNLVSCHCFMISLFCSDKRSIWTNWKVHSWVGHKISLEFCQITIEVSFEAKWRCYTWDWLCNKTIYVGKFRSLNV